NAEVAELAALAAKGNVQVKAQRGGRVGSAVQRGVGVGEVRRLPEGKRGIVGNEVVAQTGFFLRGLRHGDTCGGAGAWMYNIPTPAQWGKAVRTRPGVCERKAPGCRGCERWFPGAAPGQRANAVPPASG